VKDSWANPDAKDKGDKPSKKAGKASGSEKKSKFGFGSKKGSQTVEVGLGDGIGPESPPPKPPPPGRKGKKAETLSGWDTEDAGAGDADAGPVTGMPVTVDLTSGRVTAGMAAEPGGDGTAPGGSNNSVFGRKHKQPQGDGGGSGGPDIWTAPRDSAESGTAAWGGGAGQISAALVPQASSRHSSPGGSFSEYSRPNTASTRAASRPATPPLEGMPQGAGSAEELALMAPGQEGAAAEETPRMDIVPARAVPSSRPGTALSQYSMVGSVYSDGRPKSAHALRLRELVQNKEDIEEIIDNIFMPQPRPVAAERAQELREELKLIQVSPAIAPAKLTLDESIREVLKRELKEQEAVRTAEEKARTALLDLEEEASGARRQAEAAESSEKEKAALAKKRIGNVLTQELKRLDAERMAAHESARIEIDRLDAIRSAEEGRSQAEVLRVETEASHTREDRRAKLVREAETKKAALQEQMERARGIWKQESSEHNRREEDMRKAVEDAKVAVADCERGVAAQSEKFGEVTARTEGLRATMAEAKAVLEGEESGQAAAHKQREEEALAETRLLEKEAASVSKHLEDLRAHQEKEHKSIRRRIERVQADYGARKDDYRRKRDEITSILDEEGEEGMRRTDGMRKEAASADAAVDKQRQKVRRVHHEAGRAGDAAGMAWREEEARLEDEMADMTVDQMEEESVKWAEIERTRQKLDRSLGARRQELASQEAALAAARGAREAEMAALRAEAEAAEAEVEDKRLEFEREHEAVNNTLEDDMSDFERRMEEKSEALAARMKQERELLAQEAAARAKRVLTREELEDKRSRHESSKLSSITTVSLLEKEVASLEKVEAVAAEEARSAGELRDKRYASQEEDLKVAEAKITDQVEAEATQRLRDLQSQLASVADKKAAIQGKLADADAAEAAGRAKVESVQAKHREVVSVLQAQVDVFGQEKRRRAAELQAQWKALEAEETKAAHQLVDMETTSQEMLRKESERLQQVTEERKLRVQRLKAQAEANHARRVQEEDKAKSLLFAIGEKIEAQKKTMSSNMDDLHDKRARHQEQIQALEATATASAADARASELELLELKAGTRSMEIGMVPLELQLPIAALLAEQERLEEECRQREEDAALDERRQQREEEATVRELQERARALQEMTERERFKIEAEREDRRLRSDMRRRALEQRAATHAERDREASLKLEVMTASASDLAASVQLEESRVAMERQLRETEAREEGDALDRRAEELAADIEGAPAWQEGRFKERCDEMYADWRAKWEKTEAFKAAASLESKHAAVAADLEDRRGRISAEEAKMSEIEMEWELLLEHQERLRAGGTVPADPQTLWQQQAQAEGERSAWARLSSEQEEWAAVVENRQGAIDEAEALFREEDTARVEAARVVRARLPPLQAAADMADALAADQLRAARGVLSRAEQDTVAAKRGMEEALAAVTSAWDERKKELQERIDSRRAELRKEQDERAARLEAEKSELLTLLHAAADAHATLSKERRRVDLLKADRDGQLAKLTQQADADEAETHRKETDLERKLADAVAASREAYEAEAVTQQQRVEHQTEKLAAHHGRREKEARDAVEKLRAAQDAAREIAEVLAEAEEMLGREQVTRDRARQALEDAEEELKRLQLEQKRGGNILEIERRELEAEQRAYDEDRRLEMESISSTLAHAIENIEKESHRRVEATKSTSHEEVKHSLGRLDREKARVETERDRELAELDAREVVARQESDSAVAELDAALAARARATIQSDEVVREKGLRAVRSLAERMERQRRAYGKDMEELWQKMEGCKERLEKAGEQEVLDKERRAEEERARRVAELETRMESERRAIEDQERQEELMRVRLAEERRQARAQLDALARQMEMQRQMQEQREVAEMQDRERKAEEKRRNLMRLQDLQEHFLRAKGELDSSHAARQREHHHRLEMLDRSYSASNTHQRRPTGGFGLGQGRPASAYPTTTAAAAAAGGGARPWSAMSVPAGAGASDKTRALWEQHEAEKRRMEEELLAIQSEREALAYGLPGAPPASPPGAPRAGGWTDGAYGAGYGGGGGYGGEAFGAAPPGSYGAASSMSGYGGGARARPGSAISARSVADSSGSRAEVKRREYEDKMRAELWAFEEEKRRMQQEMADLEAEMNTMD